MADASKTLRNILVLIAKDVAFIKKTNKKELLSEETSRALCRYASTLSQIAEEHERALIKAKKEFDKRPTEELIREFQKLQKETP